VNGEQPQTYGDKSRLIDYSKVVKYDFPDVQMQEAIGKLL